MFGPELNRCFFENAGIFLVREFLVRQCGKVETGSAKTAGSLNNYFCVENIGKYFPLQIPFIKSVKELKRRGFRVHLPETFLYGIPFVFFC